MFSLSEERKVCFISLSYPRKERSIDCPLHAIFAMSPTGGDPNVISAQGSHCQNEGIKASSKLRVNLGVNNDSLLKN